MTPQHIIANKNARKENQTRNSLSLLGELLQSTVRLQKENFIFYFGTPETTIAWNLKSRTGVGSPLNDASKVDSAFELLAA